MIQSRRATLRSLAAMTAFPLSAPIPRASTRPSDVLRKERAIPLAYNERQLLSAMMAGGATGSRIPSIDRPSFFNADNPPSQLRDGDPVFGVVIEGEARAYPQYILVWHEVVNDTISGIPVAITYCPLTGTPQAFYRGRMIFRASGSLINSNLVMSEEGMETLWPQMIGWGLEGEFQGYFLDEFRIMWTSWEEWRTEYPDTIVLNEDTEHIRNYGADPYGAYNPPGGYYRHGEPYLGVMNTDQRFHPKEAMIGARTNEEAIATSKARLAGEQVLSVEKDGITYTAVYDPRFSSGWFYEHNGRNLTVQEDGVIVDGEGPYEPDSLPLTPMLAMDSFWFAWVAYFPDTLLLHAPDYSESSDETAANETEPAPIELTDDSLPGFGLGAATGGIAGWLAARRLGLIGESSRTTEESGET